MTNLLPVAAGCPISRIVEVYREAIPKPRHIPQPSPANWKWVPHISKRCGFTERLIPKPRDIPHLSEMWGTRSFNTVFNRSLTRSS